MAGDTLAEIAATVVADDPGLRARMQAFVGKLLDEADYIMMYGSPAERALYTRAVMPVLLKSLQGSDASAAETAEAAAYKRMMAELRGDKVAPEVKEAAAESQPQVHVDTPPPPTRRRRTATPRKTPAKKAPAKKAAAKAPARKKSA